MAEQARAMISIPYKDSGIPAFRACATDESRPAIILIHEVWGLTDHIKDMASRFCEQGYEVIAPDLIANTDLAEVVKPELQKVIFDPVERPKHQVELRAMMAPLGSPDFAKATLDKLNVIFEYLKNDAGVSKIFVIGFCFGGTYSFGLAANQKGLAGAVPFYGHGEQYIEKFSNIDCPVLAFYGAKDEALTEHIPAIAEAMKEADKDFAYEIYPDAGHAFFNDTNDLSYVPAAADDAWNKTLEFLSSH